MSDWILPLLALVLIPGLMYLELWSTWRDKRHRKPRPRRRRRGGVRDQGECSGRILQAAEAVLATPMRDLRDIAGDAGVSEGSAVIVWLAWLRGLDGADTFGTAVRRADRTELRALLHAAVVNVDAETALAFAEDDCSLRCPAGVVGCWCGEPCPACVPGESSPAARRQRLCAGCFAVVAGLEVPSGVLTRLRRRFRRR